MSGGVDSSVAALLLARQGYEVIGVTLRLWTVERPDATPLSKGCCSVEDIDDARRVCHTLGARHYVVNAEREFRSFVVDYFLAEYQRGRTPHPCIACNDRIKFDFLMDRALQLDADYIATGHYARLSNGPDGRVRLLRGVDPRKDQSYVLFGLGQEQLRRILLPVGVHSKERIRELAREAALPVADKPDSQDICFIPQGDYRQFLQERVQSNPGDVVDTSGRILGRHQGVELYTIGQRRGLGIASTAPLYVVDLDPEAAQGRRRLLGRAPVPHPRRGTPLLDRGGAPTGTRRAQRKDPLQGLRVPGHHRRPRRHGHRALPRPTARRDTWPGRRLLPGR